MLTVTALDALDEQVRAEVAALLETVEARDGAPPLSDQAVLAITQVRAGLAHFVARDGAALTGYAQLDGASAEIADGAGASAALLDALEQHAADGFRVWSHGQRSPVGPVAQARGYLAERTLWRLRRPLDDVPAVPLPEGVRIRTFQPGRDEQAWLAVNAAAFADHAEQGRWTLRDIEAREAEPWFDPGGFLLAERGDELLGFHWTKVHPGDVGEVYVLGIAPAAQGMRLGLALLAAGLEHLAAAGLRSVLLYVDESNDAAMRLYERFGFARDDVDVQYSAHMKDR